MTTTLSPQGDVRDIVGDLGSMRVLRYDERKRLDFSAYSLRFARSDDVAEIIREPFLLYEGDRLVAAYFHLEDDPLARPTMSRIWLSLKTIQDWPVHYRSEGLPHTSRTFGYLNRVATRRDYCTTSVLAMDAPEAHQAVAEAASVIGRYYRAVNPNLFVEHKRQAERVADDYQIEDGPFTTGIINKNNQLRYHFDKGNFTGVWSAMLGFKRDIGGGYLSLPEFNIAAEICDRSLFFFDGQGILHGVTPIRRLSASALRYTIVYYSLKTMWNCEPLGSEVDRIRRKRTVREYKRAGKQPA